MHGKKITVLAAVLTMLASSVAGATVLRSPDAVATNVLETATETVEETREQLDELESTTIELAEQTVPDAVGETVLLVVAGRAASLQEAETLLADTNGRFGELQGFYLDAAADYAVVGALVQTSPEAVSVACEVAEDGHSEIDCPDGVGSVAELQPVRLEHVGAEAFASYAFPPCGGIGLAPCQESLYKELAGDSLTLAPDGWLVVTAFRTKRGAEEFLELARAVDVTGLVVLQARKLGSGDVGLGQEPHPDGSGPLLGPLPDQELHQR